MTSLRLIQRGALGGLLLGSLLLSGCEIDLSDKKDNKTDSQTTALTLQGSVHDGQPQADVEVLIADSQGRTASLLSNAQGEFTLNVSPLQPPLLLAAKVAEGKTWYSLVQNLSAQGTVSINPLSTALLSYEALLAFGILDENLAEASAPLLSQMPGPLGQGLGMHDPFPELNINLPPSAQEKFQALLDAGIFSQQPDGQTQLNEVITRAQLSTLLARLLGENPAPATPSFADIYAGQHWALGQIGELLQVPTTFDHSAFTPPNSQELAALLAQLQHMQLTLDFNNQGQAQAFYSLQAIDQPLLHILLPDAAARREQLLAQAYQSYAQALQHSLNSFSLHTPSTWSYEVKGSVTGDFQEPHFSRSGTISLSAGSTNLPRNEAEIKRWLMEELREQIGYHGGSFTFDQLQLDATGTGVVGSTLALSAQGQISGKILHVEKYANFQISEATLRRIE